jgi:hypothetical protein
MGWSAFQKPGLTHHKTALSVKGFTLVTPMDGDATYLLDMSGRIVHRWTYDGLKVNYARLTP